MLDINEPEVQDFLDVMVEQEKEIPRQSEDQPFQDKQKLSQELSSSYTIVIHTPCIISKNQLTIGVECNKLLVIEGSFYVNDEKHFLPDDNKYDSEEIFDLLGYDLVEMLDEINMEQNEVDDVILEEEYDYDSVICDNVNNLPKEREIAEKIFFYKQK
ncbi:hypothetical protein GLOIN_2v1783228 [Rhizophagus clarus]|uniref:Uncharacterized protein n=1 Tax=Rhizophagus clarus TaxID=94130 RepID=A0A8H3LTG4_9GLOM|nr:hypothetical protein GLOIN_2v1783228 [Rhizophagus clarus]